MLIISAIMIGITIMQPLTAKDQDSHDSIELYVDHHIELSLDHAAYIEHKRTKSEHQHVVLESDYLSRLDGITCMIDGINIKQSMVFIKDLIEIQLGKLDKKTNKRIGRYNFRGKLYGIHELAYLEHSNKNDRALQQELQRLLILVKTDVMTLLRPFIDTVGATRWIISPILSEWIEKRKRSNTLLTKWNECPGEEELVFTRMVSSFQMLTRFCTDLRVFLGDLIHNCPKGYAQFEELVRQHEQQHNS